jgi:uncharacterized protein YyaL (SSP411 family)
VIVRGPAGDFAPWHEVLDSSYLPTTLALFIPDGAGPLPATLDKPTGPRVNAWVCEGVTCLPPIDSPGELKKALDLPTIAAAPKTTTDRRE